MAAKGQAGAKSRASGNSVRENGDSSGIEKINPALAKWIINVDQVKVDPRNPRTHPPYNLEAIKNSLTHFSQQTPIVISKEKIIIKGNGTYEAALALGWKKIAAIPTDLASKKLLTGYKVADNKTGDLAEWDYQILSEEMKEFIDLDWQGLGWAEWELAPILAAEWHPPEVQDEDLPGGVHSIHVTAEQWVTIKRGVDMIREKLDGTPATDGRCLELLCADWLS